MTRKQFFAEAHRLGIEIEEDRTPDGVDFVAYSPIGKRFTPCGGHMLALGGADHGERVDYARMTRELTLVPCTERNCEYCAED